MEKDKKSPDKKIGKPGYINENCWLVKTLNYAPYKRCQYCELKFHNCLFLHYQIISLILILFFLPLSFLIEGKTSELVIISVFTLVIVYGYFLNESTDKLIQANFSERKAKEALEELAENLQQKVDEQTKEIRKAYEVEKHAHRELKRLDEAKNQFILSTQHHLRTPLSIMKGYISLFLEGTYCKLNKESKEKLKSMQKANQRLINLVNDFLDITQFQLGKDILTKKEVQVEDLINQVIEELEPESEKKKIYLRFEKPETLSPKLNLDPEKFKEAVFNVVDNGIKYTQKGGITIKLKIENYKLKIAVVDTGIGMTKEEAEEVFNRFFERGEKAKEVYATGRGIGLYIASQIIKAHDGKIWAESEGKGKGSTFYIELPISV